MKIKSFGIVDIAFFAIIIGCEGLFATWLQGLINSAIPNGEYYNLIHLITILIHIFIVGPIYVSVLALFFTIYSSFIKEN